MSFFITGTDTGVGKTRASCLLIQAMRKARLDTVGFKPVCCGTREDSELLAAAADHVIPINDVNPVWMRPPAAPYAASLIEGRAVDLGLIREKFAELQRQHSHVIIEGAGGWLVPIERHFSIADLAVEFGKPVIVVAANRLGVLNHTLLTVHAVQSSGLHCAGVVLNSVTPPPEFDPAVSTNRAILEELLPVPILCELPFGALDWPEKLPFVAEIASK